VIYLYRPLRDERRQRTLERRIARQARPGAILIGVLCDFHELEADHGLVPVGEAMWVKGLGAAGTAGWRRRAARKELVLEPKHDRRRAQFWRDWIQGKGRRRLSRMPEREALDPRHVSRAVDALRAENPRLADVLSFRLIGGATVQETAQLLGISPATVRRDWVRARERLRSIQGP